MGTTVTTTTTTTTTPPPPPPRRFSAKERKALLAHLDGTKFGGNQHLVLTKNQKLALEQEKEFQGKGFAPFSSDSDPPPPPPPRQPNQIEIFLSQLPEARAQQFVAQFSQLPQDLQQYAYSKLLSVSSDVLQFAVEQFINLGLADLETSLRSDFNTDRQQERQRQQQQQPQPTAAELRALRENERVLAEIIASQEA